MLHRLHDFLLVSRRPALPVALKSAANRIWHCLFQIVMQERPGSSLRTESADIIRDAEGADHFITIDVSGLETREAACRVAKEIADSTLLKTAITGGDPNWGRIVSAAGYANLDFDTAFVSLHINGTEVYRAGTPVPFDTAALSMQLKTNRNVHLELSLSGAP